MTTISHYLDTVSAVLTALLIYNYIVPWLARKIVEQVDKKWGMRK